jgi:hypothetical protein
MQVRMYPSTASPISPPLKVVSVCALFAAVDQPAAGTYGLADSGKWKPLAYFDCRGMEPIAYDPRVCHTHTHTERERGDLHTTSADDSHSP